MVYLSKIYTRSGDLGQTSLGDGTRVAKDHARVSAYGTVDELNAVLGLLINSDPGGVEIPLFQSIQNDLFDLGADLCVPENKEQDSTQRLRILPEQVIRIEQVIDRINANLQPLTSFILPGGTPAASWCHLARTICRRAEREIISLSHIEPINPQTIVYLNRLSDLLFVLARFYNNNGKNDILWIPGKTQS